MGTRAVHWAGVLLIAVLVEGCGGKTSDADGRAQSAGGIPSSSSAGGNAPADAGIGGTPSPGLSPGEDVVAVSDDYHDQVYGEACQGWIGSLEPPPLSYVVFVVDRSAFMGRTAPGRRETDWELVQRELSQQMLEITGMTWVALTFFPRPDWPSSSAVCVGGDRDVPLGMGCDPSSAQHQALVAAFEGASPGPQTSVPLRDAYAQAVSRLEASDVLALPGVPTKTIVLVSSGWHNVDLGCQDPGDVGVPDPLASDIAAALSRGIQTLVVGTPSSAFDPDLRPWLSSAARAGGRPRTGCSDQGPLYCHWDLSGTGAWPPFGEVLNLAQVAWACTRDVPALDSGAVNLDRLTIFVRDLARPGSWYVIQHNPGAPCERGWQYSADRTNLVICGDTCQLLEQGCVGQIEYLFGCS